MGKKSGKTKSGRVMNPADRERKNQRARELKKNKKQRNIVRHAIVKARDPDEMLDQLRRLDEQEFDPKCELSKHVIVEKRTKLKGSFIQQLALYRQENDANQVTRLENLLHEYEIERQRKEQMHRAVMCSQDNIDEIPLPSGFMLPNAAMTPFMPAPPQPPRTIGGILKRRPEASKIHKEPPGPPCGLPPSFDDDVVQNTARSVQFAGNFSTNYEDYEDFEDDDLAPVAMPESLMAHRSNFQPVRPLISAPPLPPSMHSAVPPPSSIPGYQRYAEPPQRQHFQNTIITASPEVLPRSTMSAVATISAEPQMRNLKKEATRFVPTALHVNKPGTAKPKPLVPNVVSRTTAKPAPKPTTSTGKSADKVDDFLKEISDLF